MIKSDAVGENGDSGEESVESELETEAVLAVTSEKKKSCLGFLGFSWFQG